MQTQIIKTPNYSQNNSVLLLALTPTDLPQGYLTAEETSYIQQSFNAEDKRSFHFNKLQYQLFVELPKSKDNSMHFNEHLRICAANLQPTMAALAVEELYIHCHSAISTDALLSVAEGLALSSYSFTELKSKPDDTQALQKLYLISDLLSEKQVDDLNTVVEATLMARRWVNLPPNHLDAETFSKYMSTAAAAVKVKTEVLNKKQIEALKMGGLLAVNQGSPKPPTFTVMTYQPQDAINTQAIVLVGKGVVYDTGGLNLKPGNYMNDMKSDMGGGATVAATLYAVAKAKLPLYVIGIVPATDNRPGQNAYASGDVIKMYDGQTVEVINTDAEGRMLLADALAYAKKYKPELVIDVATLTGAAMRAIGKWGIAAMQVNAEKPMQSLKLAGEYCSERLVEFPMWEEYGEEIQSKIADMKHLGGAEAGHITAAKFLEKFTDYPYIHLDIAGAAFTNTRLNYRGTGGTGVGVRLLFQFFINYYTK